MDGLSCCPWCGEKATTAGIAHDPSCRYYYGVSDCGGGATQLENAEDAIAGKLDLMEKAGGHFVLGNRLSFLNDMLGSLTPEERRVFELRHKVPIISQAQIRQIERKALEKLWHLAERNRK